MKNQNFLKALQTFKILTKEEAEALRSKFKGDDFSLLIHLVINSKKYCTTKMDLGRCWADSINCSFVDLDKTLFQPSVVTKIPEIFARENNIIPIYQFGEMVTLATSDPMNSDALERVSRHIDMQISPVFSFPDDIKKAIEIQYKTKEFIDNLKNKISTRLQDGIEELSKDELLAMAGSLGIVDLVDGILLYSVKERASDIHFEPQETNVRIRFRIDGMLHERLTLEGSLMAPILTRLKILSNADITERRRPQDGRLSLKLSKYTLDFRFSSIPSLYGEKIVLRRIGGMHDKSIPDLEQLYFSKKNIETFKKLISLPNGILFITGPTGSGKTTTLYSALHLMAKKNINIVTIEDPIEYPLAGITQVQVNPDIDLNFSTALRAFLRQDPDVILIGEIRDLETARAASQAALTGHLVLSTMHTNNAIQAVTRLVEIGVEPFLVAPAVIGVMAQRLVRKICSNCKESYKLTAEQKSNLFIWNAPQEVIFYRGTGCRDCFKTGYSGRIAIHELFVLDELARKMVARNLSILEIQKYALERGFQTLRYDGMKKVLRGLTTIEELNRVTIEEFNF